MKISWENLLLPRNPQVVESGLAVHLSIIGEQDKVQFAREVFRRYWYLPQAAETKSSCEGVQEDQAQ